MSSAPSTDELGAAMLDAVPNLDDPGRRLALTVYRTLAKGMPVSEMALAEHTGLPPSSVAATLAAWPGVFRNEEDCIISFWGLALRKMPHAIQVDGVRLHAWCAWDTLFLPGILQAVARVRSTDPSSGETVELVVEPDRIAERSHSHTVVSFLVPDGQWHDDVMTTFCHYVHFFTDHESAAPWIAAHPGTFLLDLDDAFALGVHLNQARGFA
jgi:alkylmercury lyase